VKIVFRDADAGLDRFLAGPVAETTFGLGQYEWHADGANGHADPDGPEVRTRLSGGPGREYVLPRASVTVIRGRLGGGPAAGR
jgi:hypothetical protein